MAIVNFNEAYEEARRLTKIHGREVEVRTVECCDYDRSCECGGGGLQYTLNFSFCGHDAEVDPQTECEENDCIQSEYLATVRREDEADAVAA